MLESIKLMLLLCMTEFSSIYTTFHCVSVEDWSLKPIVKNICMYRVSIYEDGVYIYKNVSQHDEDVPSM